MFVLNFKWTEFIFWSILEGQAIVDAIFIQKIWIFGEHVV
jgi:hypothetical protein